MENHQTGYKKRTWIYKLLLVIQTLLMLGMVIAASFAGHLDVTYEDAAVRTMDQWYAVFDNETIPCNSDVDLAKYMPKGKRSFTLVSTLPVDITDKDELAFRISDRKAVVMIGDKRVAAFGYEDEHPLWSTSGRYFVFIPLNPSYAGKEIRIMFESTYDHERGRIPDFYIGSRWSIHRYLELMYSIRYVLARALIGVGVFLLALYMIFWLGNKNCDNKLLLLGLFMIYSCTWILTEGKLMQFRIGNAYLIYAFTFISLAMIPAPFLGYVNLVQKKRFKKLFFAAELITFALTIP